ncbi:MAG: hypothetical protein EA361_07050 [Bacteroidetes bacterium]|nr:MAG: hypothetical protein EA361_07050 [Bacteroidota bacterium]
MIKKIASFFIASCMIVLLVVTQACVYGQKVTAVSSQEFFENYLHLLEDGKTVVIDGRTQRMFSEGRLKNAINIDADDPNLIPLLQQYLDEPLIVVYCTTVRRTTDIVNTLRGMYEGEIIYISDGIRGWQRNGFPVSGISELGLEQAIKEVLQNNEHLKASNMMIEAAQAGVEEREAYYKPFVEASFQYAYLDIVPGFKRERLGNIEHTLFPFVSASQVVYSGGRLQSRQEAAEITMEQERKFYTKQAMDLKLRVHLNYFQLISAINQKNIILQSLKHLDDQEQFTRLMIQAGRMSELEVYRITVERNALRGMLLKQNNDIAMFSHELGALMGRDEKELFEPSDSLQLPPLEPGYPQLMDTALENNPVWQQLELNILQQEAQVKIRQSERNPRVSAQIWAGYEFGVEQFHFWDNKRYFAGLTASMPIYDGNMNNARIRQAQARVESTQWTRENFQKSLGAEIENLYSRLGETLAQVSIQEQSVEQGRQSYRLAMIEYQAGRRSNTDLLDIQQALIRSELQLNEAMVNYNLSRAKLLYVLGIL